MKQIDIHITGNLDRPLVSANGGDPHPLPVFTHALRGTLRWLIEDYPRLASGVAETAGQLAEEQLTDYGSALWQAVLASAPDLDAEDAELAFMIRDPNGLTRHWPWELLATSGSFASQSAAGVFRTTAQEPSEPPVETERSQKLRILSVISRPMGVSDVGFRAVARRMLSNVAGGAIEVSVLRPPTLKALSETVWQAAQKNQPFDVVHFDGHGTVFETMGGDVGAILFENKNRNGPRPAPGRAVANALSAGRVKMLLLNACDSAQAPLVKPVEGGSDHMFGAKAIASFAEEVAAHSQIDVVAMSHQLSVSNAVHIVDDLYRCLSVGGTLAEAIRYARRRWIDGEPSPGSHLGHAIIRAFVNDPRLSGIEPLPAYAPPRLSNLTTKPTVGMAEAFENPPALFGTDDTILTLDRVFDDRWPILLTGLRGAGKSETARELARWLVASGRLEPSDMAVLDLSIELDVEKAIAQVSSDEHGFLIVEHGEFIHGDSFQNRAAWSEDQVAGLWNALEARRGAGKQTLVLAHTKISGLGNLREIPIRPLELDDLRDFARSELQADLSDLLLLWTAGNPTAAKLLFDYQRRNLLSEYADVQSILRQLRNGRFTDDTLPQDILAPLIFKNPDIESDEIAPMWFLMQFQGRFVFPVPELVTSVDEIAQSFRRPYFAIFSESTRPDVLIRKLKKTGLVAEPKDGTLLLHPFLPAIIPHPYNCDPYRSEDAVNLLHAAKSFMAQYAWLASGETSKFVPEMGRSHPASRLHLHSLHNAWYSIAGDDVVIPDYVLKLGRKLRVMLEHLPDDNARQHLIDRMTKVFDDYPPEDTADGQRLALDWVNEQLSIALADHDKEKAQVLSQQVADMEGKLEAVAADDAQASEDYARRLNAEASFDNHWKAGKALAQDDPETASQAFASAFQAAGNDISRQALAALELARLTSTRKEVLDLDTAETFATLAYNGFVDLSKANLVERGRVSEAALTASRIALELARRDNNLEEKQTDGLAFAIMARDDASNKNEEALAAFNFGNWLRQLRKHGAAEEFIKASSLFEEIGNERNKARSLLFYGVALFESKGTENALDPINRARVLFEKLNDKESLDLTDVYLEHITAALNSQ